MSHIPLQCNMQQSYMSVKSYQKSKYREGPCLLMERQGEKSQASRLQECPGTAQGWSPSELARGPGHRCVMVYIERICLNDVDFYVEIVKKISLL